MALRRIIAGDAADCAIGEGVGPVEGYLLGEMNRQMKAVVFDF